MIKPKKKYVVVTTTVKGSALNYVNNLCKQSPIKYKYELLILKSLLIKNCVDIFLKDKFYNVSSEQLKCLEKVSLIDRKHISINLS